MTGPERGRVVVVGAGPAGLSAARTAAEAGVRVLLIDSGARPGGQYHRQSAVDGLPAVGTRSSVATDRPRVEHPLIEHPLIEYLAETTVWAIEPVDGGQRLRLQTGPADAPRRTVRTIDAAALILATGAYDRALPFPGWDLPGVYTAGAAQALAKGQHVAVGKRVLVAGTGPFLLPVARSLVEVGATVVGVLEANHRSTIIRGWRSAPRQAVGKLGELTSYAASLARHRIPYKTGTAVTKALGTNRVEAVTVARLDKDWRPTVERIVEVDAVCVGYGFTAQLEFAVSAGCELVTAPDGGAAIRVDEDQRTTVPGVYAAGEVTGVAGAAPAAAEGAVAGAAAARQLGNGSGPSPAQRRTVADGNRLKHALARAYPIGQGWRGWLDEGTLVCRCEETTYQELLTATNLGADTGRALKLTSRAGLGMCQGRVCARNVAELAGLPADHAGASRRPIAVPVRLRDLATVPEEESQ